MVKSTFILDAKQYVNSSNRVSLSSIINTSIMGAENGVLDFYSPSNTYNRGDKIPYISDDGELLILVAVNNGITGTFNPLDWEEWSVMDELKGLYDDYIVASFNRPSLRRNKVWLAIKEESLADLRDLNFELGNEMGLLIYNNLVFSERRPIMTSDLVWGNITEKI